MKSFKEQDFSSLNPYIPTKTGQLVIAQFSADGNWYRAQVEKINTDATFLLFYIDYGNSEVVKSDKIRQLDNAFNLSVLQPQAHFAKLAYVRSPTGEDEFSRDAAAFLKEMVWDKQLVANVQFRTYQQDTTVVYLVLGDPDAKFLVNSEIVRHGLARVDRESFGDYRRDDRTSELISKLREEEAKAMKERINIWQYGDVGSDDEM